MNKTESNLYERILAQAKAERHRRARRFPVSGALLKKAAEYRNSKGIAAPWSPS